MPKANKATDAQVEQRTMEIYHCLLIGKRRAEILQYVAEKEWGIETRMVDNYITRANNLFKKQSKVQRERELGKAVERLNFLFMKALNINDYKTALSVQKEIGALFGLNAPTRSEHFLLNIPPEVIRRFVGTAAAANADPVALFEELINALAAEIEAGRPEDSRTS